jgi:DNA polymerase
MLIHDEVITECPDTPDYNVTQLSELLSTVPPWATGLPLAAAGFETKRYYKG